MSRSMRFIRETEAKMLGEYIEPVLPPVCWHLPTTLEGLKKLTSDDLRSTAYWLGCYEPVTAIAHRRHADIAVDVLLHLEVVSLENAPRTLEGLLALGTHRLRYLVGLALLYPEARSQFIAPRKGRGMHGDLSNEVVAQRLLYYTKELDKTAGRIWDLRPMRLTAEELTPAKDKPPPALPAKLQHLVERSRKYLATFVIPGRPRVGNNHAKGSVVKSYCVV